jgi:acid phosphatase (class A)
MKFSFKPFPFFHAVGLAAALSFTVVAITLRADDQMSQPGQPVPASQLHYLAGGRPDAIALLAPPPLPDSAEQAADLAEVKAVFRAASSNDIAAAYSEKKFSIFNFTPAIGDFF